MRDPRIARLARNLVGYSTRVARGDRVLIEATDVPPAIVEALVREAHARGGLPVVDLKSNAVQRVLYQLGSEETLDHIAACERFRMERTDVYIALRGFHNLEELSDVDPERMTLYQTRWFKPVHLEVRVPKTRWVVLRWPTPAMAQAAHMSTEAFEDFYFDVCTLDYGRMSAAMDPLQELMQRTDRVRIVGPGETDLRFSIKDIGAVKCDGQYNIPDGECYSAPVRDSVQGVIAYNTASHHHGATFRNVRLVFRDGRIVEATGDPQERLDEIFDTDEGARYVGEFSLGFNPHIREPLLDTLFDEKIAGSFHFTPGAAYDDCDNGNRSAVHWDLVAIQRPEHGGGEIWFDDVLIRKDGLFVLPELEGLNPEALLGGGGAGGNDP